MLRKMKRVEVCASCSEDCTIPPGDYYRGLPYHKGCLKMVRRRDVTDDVIAPRLDRIEQGIQELLDV